MHPEPPSSVHGDLQREVSQIAELAGGLAHELRNPLSTMMINLKLLAEDLQDFETHPHDTQRRALLKVDILRREAERLQALFDEFLSLTGPFVLRRSPTDLNIVVGRLVEFCEPLMKANRVCINVAVESKPLECSADEKLLSQALLNLVINAQQAMPNGGELTITTSAESEWAVIAVGDTGVGIAEADQARILRPFFSTKARGTGLGLSIARRIVEEHGGTLTFTSQLGRGTTFTIRLPVGEALPSRP